MDSIDQYTPESIPLGCQIAGQAQDNPVVFVHGSTVTGRSWKPQMEALKSDYRVIACDLRGQVSHF